MNNVFPTSFGATRHHRAPIFTSSKIVQQNLLRTMNNGQFLKEKQDSIYLVFER